MKGIGGVGFLSGIASVEAGSGHSVAGASDGTVYAWGWNAAGQLGDGTTNNQTTPIQVSGVSGASVVIGGSQHSGIVKADGTAQSWGGNYYGQPGDGTRDNRTSAVSGLSGVNAGASGQDHSLAAATISTAPQTASHIYDYDTLYRLTTVSGDRSASYGYGPAGNMSAKDTTTYSYDRADRITTVGGVTYSVNANGNLTARGSDAFTYDQANRLKTASVGGTASSYVYDGDGKRASKTVGSTPTAYVYDVNASLPVLLDDATRKYVWGLGLAFAVDSSGNPLVYHTDGLGSVRALTDASGSVVQTYLYDEYGVVTSSQGSITQPFQFTGEPRDETGFMYLRARMYDAGRGRSTGKDALAGTLGSPPSLHRYAYGKYNPLINVDPSGMYAQEAEDTLPPGWTDEMVRETLYGNGKIFVAFDIDNLNYGSPIDKVIFVVTIFGSRGGSGALNLARFAGVAGREAILSKVVLSDGALNLSQTVARKLATERSFIPMQGILEAIGSGARGPDPQDVAGHFRYSIEASHASKSGVLEVLVDEATG